MIDLYMLETCPYCHKVMDYLDKYEIPYNKLDISKPENLANLMKLGGREQVPFLHNRTLNNTLYESDKIIDYITKLKDTQ
jgi:glutaredoxin